MGAGSPLASPDTTASGRPVDGISCLNGEQVAYHIHIHLAVFVNGHPRQIPAGVGIVPPRQVQTTPVGAFINNGTVIFANDTANSSGLGSGAITLNGGTLTMFDSPATANTVANFFDIWQQQLGRDRVGPARAPVTVFLNGHRDNVDPRSIPLTAHQVIELDVGTPLIQ